MTDVPYTPTTTIRPDEDMTLIPASRDDFGTADDALRPDPLAPRPSLRRAVGQDVADARNWSRTRAVAAREAVAADPMRSTLTALGVGVVIGVLLRR